MAVEDNWPAVVANLRKARKVWARLSRILGIKVVDWRMLGRLCVAAMQATLLLGLETWVVIYHMARTLGGFHHQVVRRIMEKLPKQQTDGVWEYPLIAHALREAGIEEL